MTNKLVVIKSLQVPKIKKILLYEMKFLVPNYSCLQSPWVGGYRSPDPRSLCPLPSTEFVEPPPPPTKFLGKLLSECDCALFLVLLVLRDIHTLLKCVYDFCNMRIVTPSSAFRIILELLKRETVRCWRVTCDMFLTFTWPCIVINCL